MPALDFPASPTDGQVYNNWVWSASKSAWNSLPLLPAQTTVSPVAPGSPAAGNLWFNSNDMGLYVYYTDVDSSQWVQVKASSSLNTTIPARMDNLEAKPLALNYLLNADFGINQRNFTSTTTAGSFGFDRWLYNYAGGTSTYSAQTFTPGTIMTDMGDATNYARIITSGQSATSDYTVFIQRVEDVHTLAGQPVTISFWARTASGTPKVAVDTIQNFGTGGSANVTTLAGQVTLSSTWTRYSLTMTVPSIAGKTVGTSSLFQLQFWLSAGSDWNSRTGSLGIQSAQFEFFGVQLEYGTAVTAFRRNQNTQQAELAACQRYYYRVSPTTSSSGYPRIASGYLLSTTRLEVPIQFPVRMRITPTTFDITNPTNFRAYSGGAMSVQPVTGITYQPADSWEGAASLWVDNTGGTYTTGQGAGLILASGLSGSFGFSAEL